MNTWIVVICFQWEWGATEWYWKLEHYDFPNERTCQYSPDGIIISTLLTSGLLDVASQTKFPFRICFKTKGEKVLYCQNEYDCICATLSFTLKSDKTVNPAVLEYSIVMVVNAMFRLYKQVADKGAQGNKGATPPPILPPPSPPAKAQPGKQKCAPEIRKSVDLYSIYR